MLLPPLLAILSSPGILISLGRPRHVPRSKASPCDISIVIPARNEQDSLPRLLTSLKLQTTAPLEILVIDDQSTDSTAGIASEHGASVIAGKPAPPGWLGKTWACQQGADHAAGEWLLFLDADTTLLPAALDRLAALTAAEPDAVHSICPYHRVEKPYEQLSAYFNTLSLIGVDAFAATPATAPTLFGQCLLIRSKHYHLVGGHRAVKSEILENFHLAKLLAARRISLRHYLGRGTVEMRMFPEGLGQLIRSWSKGSVAGATQSPRRAQLVSSFWLSSGMLTLILLCLVPLIASAPFTALTLIAYTLFASSSFYGFRMAGNFSPLAAIFFPIPLLFYQWLFLKSLLLKNNNLTWKGRPIS